MPLALSLKPAHSTIFKAESIARSFIHRATLLRNNAATGKNLGGAFVPGAVIGVAVDLTAPARLRFAWVPVTGMALPSVQKIRPPDYGGVTVAATVAFSPVVNFGGEILSVTSSLPILADRLMPMQRRPGLATGPDAMLWQARRGLISGRAALDAQSVPAIGFDPVTKFEVTLSSGNLTATHTTSQ